MARHDSVNHRAASPLRMDGQLTAWGDRSASDMILCLELDSGEFFCAHRSTLVRPRSFAGDDSPARSTRDLRRHGDIAFVVAFALAAHYAAPKVGGGASAFAVMWTPGLAALAASVLTRRN